MTKNCSEAPFWRFFCSSIGLKFFMSLTGLSLCVFLLAHVLGNIVILIDPPKFNEYAYALNKNQMILLMAEMGLLAVFVLHILVAIKLTRLNRAARPTAYVMRANTGRSRRWWASSNMIFTGLFVVVFLFIHLKNFKFGSVEMTTQGATEMRNLAQTVTAEFSNFWMVSFYIVAMLFISFHLLHGFRSAFETLGVVNSRWDKFALWTGRFFVFIVMGGFILIPLLIFYWSRTA